MKNRKFSETPTHLGVPVPILRVADVEKLTRVPRRTIYDWIQKGRFPKAVVKLGKQSRAWRTDDVMAWIDARLSEADAD